MSEPDVSDLLTVAQAIAMIDGAEVTPRVIEVSLAEADGLRLAQDVVADRDYPPFDKSLMDGFAVRSADVARVPVELNVVGEIAAGRTAAEGLDALETMAIMTGAPLPEGADGVVPVEDIERLGDRIRVLSTRDPGRFVAKRGADVRSGAVLLQAGAKLGPAQLAVAASVGASRVRVFARPRAAILATGDEIIPIDASPRHAQIRNSNSLMLVSLLKRLGCDVADLGVARDDPDTIRDALQRAQASADTVFVTGGMSMGEYDYVPGILKELGVDLRITKLRIKPGKPFVFGAMDGCYVFGLPGNPVSGYVCTIRLAARLIARMAGGTPEPRWMTAPLTAALKPNGPREFYQPAVLDETGATPLEWKGSADVFTLAGANALLVRMENEPARAAGEIVRVLEVPT
jgi:molybdopterin molybdotransferase